MARLTDALALPGGKPTRELQLLQLTSPFPEAKHDQSVNSENEGECSTTCYNASNTESVFLKKSIAAYMFHRFLS